MPQVPDHELIAYVRGVSADENLLLGLWQETPVAKRRAFVDAVVATGGEHLDALISGARRLVKVNRELAMPLMMMLGPHLPDPTSGELLVEQMADVLRRNRRRADTDEGKAAERVLQHDELRGRGDDER